MTTSSPDTNMIEKEETTEDANTQDAAATEITIRAMEATTDKEMAEDTKMTTEGKHEIYKNDL